MAKPGPAARPRHLKLLEGGKRAAPDATPLGEPGRCGSTKTSTGRPCRRRTDGGPCYQHAEISDVPAPPEQLSDAAKRVWRELVPHMLKLNLVTVLDRRALAHLCEKEAIADEAAGLIQRDGILVKGAKGVKKNPAIQIHRDATTELRLLYKEFGLTPASRSGMDLPDEKPQSAMDRLLSGRPD